MVLREPNDPLSQSRGIMGPLGNSAVQNNRGRLRQRFDLIRKLGQGTYGKVQLGIDKETGQEVAIKTIKKSKIETEADLIRIRREIQIMSSVRHPNIIHIYEVFENREKMVLVMEYAAGGELYDYLNDRKILQEDEARRIFRQIASAVYYCHKHKICHRDLKLENILLDESANAKIADFGLSNVFDDINLLKTFCGSPLYASPEIVRGTPYYGPEVDCWSLGVLLYTLVYGAMPFDGSNFKRLVKQISNGDYYEPKKPAEASLLIRRMLTVDPVKRASIKDVCAHQWINQGFDKECLSTAEELANQTPVRLDVLLSVAPAYNINHSQVVIACDQGDGDGAVAGASGGGPSKGDAAASKDSLNAIAEPKKAKKDNEQPGTSKPGAAPMEKPARPSLNKEKEKQPAPPKEVKRKAAVKKKSKSSPILELIVDEEEEMDKLEPLEIIDGSPEDDDDAGDTLSEISEIQTIAEDIKDMAKSKSKLKVKSEEQKKEPAKQEPTKEEPVKEKTVQQPEAQPAAAPSVVKEVRKKPKTEAESKVTESKEEKQPPKPAEAQKEVVVEVKPEKPPAKKSEEPKEPESTPPKPTTTATTETATSKPNAETVAKPPTVKKKLVKKASVDKGENKGEEDKNKSSTKSLVASSNTGSSSSLASSAGGKSGTKLDKESKSESGSKPKLRARSDSLSSDASPTRIERRNSKVISQKTAELIQNLETKQSLGSTDGTKPKKLVFPSLKVSDAKRAFEKPPKPVKEPSSPPVKKSPTEDKSAPEFKKPAEKQEGSELTVAKPKKTKSKSPSPIPDEAKQNKAKTDKQIDNSKTVEAKKETPKEAEPPEVKEKAKEPAKEKPAVAAKPAVAPKPTEKVKEPEKPTTLAPSESQTKQKSVSPKPQKKVIAKQAPEPKSQSVSVPSPEPPSEMTTVSDSLNTEIDRTISEVPKKTAPKPLKKLKIPTPSPSPVPNPDQLVKPVLVDNGSGTPKQAVMLMHGRTTPPVKNSADLDTSMSTDPFFSQTESISVSLPKDKVKPAVKLQEKQQAAKKISSVISRIASSESAERIMNEDKKGKKVVKSEVEKFVNAPDKSNKTQRTEVSFPVAAAPSAERIIPIRFEDDVAPSTPPTPATTHPHINVITQSSKTQSAPNINISRMPLRKSVDASSSTLFSRQNSSDTESSIAPPPKPEPIRKSPREFIIPIKLETSGQTVLPKDDVSEASQSEDPFRMDSRLRSGRFGRHKRYSSLLSDSSLEEEPASTAAPTTSVSASTSRRSSAAAPPCHARSHSQGDEPDTPTTPLGTFKKYRMRRAGGLPLDRSDSFSSAEEDEEDAFEVLTAESLFSSLLDRVRNLTKRINRDEAPSTAWQGPESPGFMFGSANPFREFMSRAPSETRSYTSTGPTGSYTMTRSFSREPSVTVTISTGPTWRRSLSREMSGGSVFHSRGSSFAGADPGDTCTVRSLPLNLSSARRSPFMSQRSEPHGIPDSPLSSYSTTPTARPYGRTMSNTDYNTSVTLPFRRSVKTYDRPSVYGHSDYTDSYTPMSSTSSMNYNTPSRSNSLMSRYTGSSSNSVAAAGGIPEPPYSRFSRSVSRARTTPDADMGRYHRDISATRQLDNPLLSSYRNPGESNGWVGGSNSSSVKTAAATAKMTTQEKMNNYQNYYQGLSQNPLRSGFPESTSPTPFLETFTDNFASPNSAFARRSPVYETSFIDTQLHNNNDTDSGLAPSKIIRPVKPVSPHNRSFTTRELSSPPMLSKPADPAPTNIPKWPNISIKTHRPVNVANFTEANLSNQNPSGDPVVNTTTPIRVNTSRSIPSIVNRAPVENPINSVLPGSPQTVSSVASPQPQPPPSHMSVATMRPQNPTTFRVLSPPPAVNPNPVTELPKTSPTGPPITAYNKIPRRDARATSVEKITRLLERKSMPRERVVSPPPQVSSPPTPTPNQIEISRTPEAVSPSSTVTLKSEEDASDRSLNASPEKFRVISNSNSLQRIGKPKFLQNLEKKWEKLTSPSPQTVREIEKPSRKEDAVAPISLPQDSSDESEAQSKPASESMLLQRAVSPEKKLRSKFGASTVNYMLGKFKRFEENSSGSKIPAGKPPSSGLSNSKIGRRVQSVYAGACSDSILALPRETTPSRIITNGIPDHDKSEQVASNVSKSRISPRLERAATVVTTTTAASPSSYSTVNSLGDSDIEDSKQKPHLVRRPVSLGIFSGGSNNNNNSSSSNVNPSKTNPSLIPRLNRSVTPKLTIPCPVYVDNERTPMNECPTPTSEAPQIHIIPDSKISDDPDDNLLTPTSISDSFDSSSICSEKTEMSRSVLDDEESVSDRIFRKSFYPRFNSLDRKKSKSTPSNPRHYTPKVGKSPVVARSSLSPSNHCHESVVNNINNPVVNSLAFIPTPNSISNNISPIPPTCSSTPSPTTVGLSSKINKYNPNPLFKELITDDFKSEVGSKAEYSRRVTSKLSKLLKEIESDIGSSGATTSSQTKDMTNNLKNSLSAGSNALNGKNRKSLSPSPGRFIDMSQHQQQSAVERSGSNKSNSLNNNNSDSAGKNGQL